MKCNIKLSICPVFFNSCRRLPETKRHSSLLTQNLDLNFVTFNAEVHTLYKKTRTHLKILGV